MKKRQNPTVKAKEFTASRGYDYDLLSKHQKLVVDNFVRTNHGIWLGVSMIAISAVLLSVSTFFSFYALNRSISFFNSKEVIFYAVVTERYDRIIEPAAAQNMVSSAVETATVNGVRLAASVFLFAVLITAIVYYREKKKIIDAFLPSKTGKSENEDAENKLTEK